MADSDHDSETRGTRESLDGFRTADEESESEILEDPSANEVFAPPIDARFSASELIDNTLTSDSNRTVVYNPDWSNEVTLQYLEAKRTQLLQAVVGGRLDPTQALSDLDLIEAEQDQLGLLEEVDEYSFRQIRADLQARIDSTMAYTPQDFADSLKTAIKAMHESSKPKKKDHNPPTLSEVSAIQWKTFRSGFELASTYNEWDSASSIMKLRLSMKDEAARAVEHVSLTECTTLEEALTKFEVVFVNPSGQDLAEVEFKKAKRKKDETFQAFHIRLRNLFCRAFPDDTPEESKLLKDTYVLHLGDPETSRQLRASTEYRGYKYSQVLTRSQDILAANSLVRQAYPSSGGLHEINLSESPEEPESSVNLIGNGECFHCQQKGHLARDCPIANRVVKRIRENPAAWGFSKIATNKFGKNNSSRGKSNNSNPGYVSAEKAPSTPLWGRQHVQRSRTGGTSRWRSRRSNRRTEQMAALEEHSWDEENPLPEDVAQLLQEDAEEGASGAPQN